MSDKRNFFVRIIVAAFEKAATFFLFLFIVGVILLAVGFFVWNYVKGFLGV